MTVLDQQGRASHPDVVKAIRGTRVTIGLLAAMLAGLISLIAIGSSAVGEFRGMAKQAVEHHEDTALNKAHPSANNRLQRIEKKIDRLLIRGKE